MFDSLKESREKYEQIDWWIKYNIWGGIFFLIGCLIGAFLNLFSLSEDFALGVIFAGFILFFSTLMLLLYWYFIKTK